MTRKPAKTSDSPPDAPLPESAADNAPQSLSRGQRLSDDQRAEILRLHAEKLQNKAIAEKVGTTPATVGRVIAAAGGSSSERRQRGRRPAAAPAAAPTSMSDMQRRLMQIGIARVLGEPEDENEIAALRDALKARLEEAARRAREEELRSL